MCAVIKANAYGHGIEEIAKIAAPHCKMLSVARMCEAKKIRDIGIKAGILVLSEFDTDSLRYALNNDITLTVHEMRQMEECARLNAPISVHIKVDTGMNRLGIKDMAELRAMTELAASSRVRITGIYTHFANADDANFTEKQFDKFMEYVSAAKTAAPQIIAHAAASDAIFMDKRYHLDMVRPGIAMYGLHLKQAAQRGIALKTAMEVKSSVVCVKTAQKGEYIGYGNAYKADKALKYAVISAGYGDGYKRANSQKSEIYIGGKPRKILGNVCMDIMMAEADDGVTTGQTAVLLSNEYERASFDRQAVAAGTIVYEIVTSFSDRVSREYIYQ